MKKSVRHISVLAIAALTSFAIAAPAAAKPGKNKRNAYTYDQPIMAPGFMPAERSQLPQWAQQRISYSQAKSIAMSRYPSAQYIDTQLSGNTYIVILVLPNTKKIKVKIDAATGRIR